MSRRRPQKGKDGKRPRHFHRGRAQGRINERLLVEKLEPAYARAEANREEVAKAARATQAEINDWRELLAGLVHVAPTTLDPRAWRF